MAPKPLPGYGNLQASSTQILVDSAYRLFASPRKTQNEAAAAALSIVFETLALPNGDDAAIAFVRDTTDRLSAALDRLKASPHAYIEELGIHGLLQAIE